MRLPGIDPTSARLRAPRVTVAARRWGWLRPTVEFVWLLAIFAAGLGVMAWLGTLEWRLDQAVIALVPVLLYLVVTDQLSTFRAAGVEVALREEARTPVDEGDHDEPLDVPRHDVMEKGPVDVPELVDRIRAEQPDALSIEVGREGYYAAGAIETYLDLNDEHNPNLEYVVFFDTDDDTFEGVTTVEGFRRLLSRDRDVVDQIEDGSILDRPAVVTQRVQSNATRGQALDIMNEEDLDFVGVVDPAQQYVTTVSVEDVVRETVTGLLGSSP